jgi:phage FluMu protein Com
METGCPNCVWLNPMPRGQSTPACRLGECKFEPRGYTLIVCCMCGKEYGRRKGYGVSHGYCPDCHAIVKKQLEQMKG